MLSVFTWSTLSARAQQQRLKRAASEKINRHMVSQIIARVKEQGDQALIEYTRAFDQVDLSALRISKKYIHEARISETAYSAIQLAIKNITMFHQADRPSIFEMDTASGVSIRKIYRPIQKVGLYIPGGKHTPLVSSLLMQAIPARIAGCPVRVLCTPPNAEGMVDPHVLVAARLCHIDTVYSIGGAQAVAAMAYGTESVTKVDKIFGPGNAYVTEAKMQVSVDSEGAAIDMPAGPSELMIIADRDADAHYVASDVLAQAEHGTDSQVILLCETKVFADAVNEALTEQMRALKRKAIIGQALQHSSILLCASRTEMISIVNQYAPEHLIINCVDAIHWIDDVVNAGTVFLGAYATETMGDYITGSNHVLPTHGCARTYSGLSTRDFLKSINIQSVNQQGIHTLGKAAYNLAMMEGLDAHAQAVNLRLQSIERTNHDSRI